MHQNPPPLLADSAPALSLTSTLRLGLLVLFSEIKWMILLAFRNWEIAQLQKRLHQELHSLGLAEAAMAGLDVTVARPQVDIFNEKDLALKQISFLSDEIKHLATQRDAERQEYVQRRVRSWNL